MTAIIGTRLAADGTRLATHHWPVEQPRAAIVLLHGLGEHLGRYSHVGPQLAARGFDVRGTDLRGFGASAGPRAHVDSFDTYLTDISGDVEAALRLGVPVALYGHSLGGLEALLYATSAHPRPHLLVLSSPAIHNSLPRSQQVMVRLLGRLTPRMRLTNPVDVSLLSRDQSVGEVYAADPLVERTSTFGLAAAAFDALGAVPDAVARLDLPTLVTHGSDDRIVAPAVSEPLDELPLVERVVYDGFWHEPCNEEGGVEAVATIADWIDGQLAR